MMHTYNAVVFLSHPEAYFEPSLSSLYTIYMIHSSVGYQITTVAHLQVITSPDDSINHRKI